MVISDIPDFMRTILLPGLLTLLLISCKEKAALVTETIFYFREPQPQDDSEIGHIPSKYIGDYRFGDHSILHVEKNVIWSEFPHEEEVSREVFDSLKKESVYRNGVWILKDTGLEIRVTPRDTTFLFNYKYADTSFTLGSDTKVKRIHGSLVISVKDSIFWNVQLLQKSHDTLYLKGFYNKSDYSMAKQIVKDVKANADTTMVTLNPTRKEFISILRNSKQLDGQSFKRIKS